MSRTYTEDQVEQARDVMVGSRNVYLRDHDKDEMLIAAELLMEEGAVEEIQPITKTKLIGMLRSYATEIIQINLRESCTERARTVIDTWAEVNGVELERVESETSKDASALSDNPFEHGRIWQVDRILSNLVEANVRREIRNELYDLVDGKWVRNLKVTIRKLTEYLIREVLRQGRSTAHCSTSQLHNLMAERELEALCTIVQGLREVVADADRFEITEAVTIEACPITQRRCDRECADRRCYLSEDIEGVEDRDDPEQDTTGGGP